MLKLHLLKGFVLNCVKTTCVKTEYVKTEYVKSKSVKTKYVLKLNVLKPEVPIHSSRVAMLRGSRAVKRGRCGRFEKMRPKKQ